MRLRINGYPVWLANAMLKAGVSPARPKRTDIFVQHVKIMAACAKAEANAARCKIRAMVLANRPEKIPCQESKSVR